MSRCFSEATAEFPQEEPWIAVMTDAVPPLRVTGYCKSEILTFEWARVDWRKSCLRLLDVKTEAQVVPLNLMAWRPSNTAGTQRDLSRPAGPQLWRAFGAEAAVTLRASVDEGQKLLRGLGHHWEKVRLRADGVARRRALESGEHPRRRTHADQRQDP